MNPSIPTTIVAIHFSPLPGRPDSPGAEVVLEQARNDLAAAQEGGADAVIFENNYDIPHTETIDPASAQFIIETVRTLKPNIPFGFSILWNDYPSALQICNETGGSFIRVPVFVDDVKTSYGTFLATPQKILALRNRTAPQVKLYCDVQVKHAELLTKRPLAESVLLSQKEGADALIITGNWTGQPPSIADLEVARKNTQLPIIVGSGATKENKRILLELADGLIVGTSLKEDIKGDPGEVNVKPFRARIDVEKVKDFINA